MSEPTKAEIQKAKAYECEVRGHILSTADPAYLTCANCGRLLYLATVVPTPPSIPRCATCKHWDSPENSNKNACNRINFDWKGRRAGAGEAELTDPSSLWTPATFGCTLHETKEPTNG